MSIRLAITLALSLVAIAAGARTAAAQSDLLIGAWTNVSVGDVQPGRTTPLYGEKPEGLLIFDAQGRYSLQLCASGRPKYAAKDRTKGTAEEYRANALGCNPHWGRYALDEAQKIIVFKIDHAMFGNWENTVQNRRAACFRLRLRPIAGGGTLLRMHGLPDAVGERRAAMWQATCMAMVQTGPGRTDGDDAMPTDLAAVMRRRAVERAQGNVAVLLFPLLMCILTVAMSLESPAFAATFRLFGVF